MPPDDFVVFSGMYAISIYRYRRNTTGYDKLKLYYGEWKWNDDISVESALEAYNEPGVTVATVNRAEGEELDDARH